MSAGRESELSRPSVAKGRSDVGFFPVAVAREKNDSFFC